jgi:hypothetical protein
MAWAGTSNLSSGENLLDGPTLTTANDTWFPSELYPGDFMTTEYDLFGPYASVQWQSFASASDGGTGQDLSQIQQESKTGRKVKSGLLSFILPGAGQYYNGERTKAYVFAGVEAAIWVSYLAFNSQGSNRTNTYQDYANIYAGVNGEHVERYWQAVGRYMDSDAYNESVRREARALGETPAGLVEPTDSWQWRNTVHLDTYQDLRANANRAYDRRDFMILFAILNRAVSVYDAVRHNVDKTLSPEVMGFKVDLDVSPSLSRPRARCAFKRSF